MIAYVVMGNDYPDAVFSQSEEAAAYCTKQREKEEERNKREGRKFYAKIYWRVWAFEIDQKITLEKTFEPNI
jgi:hypothetical protein